MYCPSLGRGLGITPFSSEVLDFRPVSTKLFFSCRMLKGIYPEFQVIRGFSQKIPAGLLSYDQIHS